MSSAAPSSPVPLLEVVDLVKEYPGVLAVDGVSFAIEAGTCFGLLGPNGAGKTTTVEIMEGITRPTSGTVVYEGRPIDRGFKEVAGIQFQQAALQDYLTVREVLELFGSFYPRAVPVADLARLCSLEEFVERDTRKLSGGQRQRLMLALALVNDPEVVFLDEPTTGLDPQARHNFWRIVEDIKAARKTLVLTTHYMEEAYVLCDQIVIMDRGRILAQGPPKALLREQFTSSVVELPEEDVPAELALPWEVRARNGTVEIHTDDVNATLRRLMDGGISLHRLKVHSPTLEDLFLELTGRDLRG
jgi:ABC-2 type transport system ATP-binding protein